MTERVEKTCPKCKSQLRAVIDNKIMCLTSGCDYIYREDTDRKFRAEDKTIAELMRDYK